MKKSILIAFMCLFATACASGRGPKGPQHLVLKAPQGTEYTAYRSQSASIEYYESQVVREKSETVEFVVEAKPAEMKDVKDNRVGMVLTTVAKEGNVALHDFGFPEQKESIEFHYTTDGKVLKAGGFNPQSLFFVPPLPLPTQAVEEGDTWQLEHNWVSASGIELNLNVVGIHKGFASCGEASPCVKMEISGAVKPSSDRIVGMELSSQISGELLFSIPLGGVFSSQVRSAEKLEFPNRRIESKSCMVSVPAQKPELKTASFPKCSL